MRAAAVVGMVLVGGIASVLPCACEQRSQRGPGELAGALSPPREDPPAPAGPDAASLANRLERMRAFLGEGFHVAIDGFFVVGTDLDPVERERIVAGTLRGCTRALAGQFFQTLPTWPIAVYLFRDADSYRAGVRRLSGAAPTTPFGYYSSDRRALVMNIHTGTGTLVHELVHALMDADFPEVRAWFNEGLGSLFEQCRHSRKGLVGLVNWRLDGLLQTWREVGSLPSLAELVALSDGEFYGEGSDLHYAMARYFCMYLQERGVLERFFRLYRAGWRTDPSGRKALEKALGSPLAHHDAPWRAFLRRLATTRNR